MVLKMTQKEDLREQMLYKLKILDQKEKERRNARIKERLLSEAKFKNANYIMSYVSKPYEVDTWEIIKCSLEMGKKVAVPYVLKEERVMLPALILDPQELILGPYGVHQPHPDNIRQVDLSQIEIILVPGIAFDKAGNRLGHGKGYFDRFLRNIPSRIHSIGLAYEFQILQSLPVSPNDVPVSALIYA